MDEFLTKLLQDDSPLTLAGLAYIVYKLHINDKKQTKAIRWLRFTLSGILIRIENLEAFNQEKYPNEWHSARNIPKDVDPNSMENIEDDF